MDRRTILSAWALAAATLFWTPAAPAQLVEQELPALIDSVRVRMQQTEELDGVQLSGGEIARRALGPGRDVRLHADGARLEQRVLLHQLVWNTMMSDPPWYQWLQQNNGVVVLYDTPPVDLAQLVPVSPTSEESLHIHRLLQAVQDEIEQDPSLGGALVRDAVYGQRGLAPGRELWVAGKLVDDRQHALVQQLLVEAMAADTYWLEQRGSVFPVVRDLAVAPLSPVLEGRYYAMGLNEFFLGRYLVANDAFMRALAENPSSRILRYWRVVGLVAVGELNRAERKLRVVIADDPWGQYNGLIARELERIQGPIRWQLQDLEQRILLTLNR